MSPGLGSVTISSSRAVWRVFVGDDQAADNTLGPVRTDDDRGAVLALIGFEQHSFPIRCKMASTDVSSWMMKPRWRALPASQASNSCRRMVRKANVPSFSPRMRMPLPL